MILSSGHDAEHFAALPCAYDACEASAPKDGLDPTVRAWIVYGCNVPLTLPDPKRVIEVMQQLEFVVAIDTMPAEVTGYADVVLPEIVQPAMVAVLSMR